MEIYPKNFSAEMEFCEIDPMSANLSTIGIMKGPARLRCNDGKESMYGMKGSSLKWELVVQITFITNPRCI
jgi:hypothetical protein